MASVRRSCTEHGFVTTSHSEGLHFPAQEDALFVPGFEDCSILQLIPHCSVAPVFHPGQPRFPLRAMLHVISRGICNVEPSLYYTREMD